MSTQDKDPRTQTLKGVILSFTDGIKEKRLPRNAEPGTKEKHNFNIIVPSGTPHTEENLRRIGIALKAAGEKQWKDPDAYRKIAEDNPKRVTFKKGERFKNKEGQIYAGYEGHHAFAVSGPGGGERRPKLLDRYKRKLREQADAAEIKDGRVFEEGQILDIFYSGTRADVIVSFYGTDKGSRGVFATAEVVRSHQEGERMAGGYVFDESDMDEFEDFGDDGLDEISASETSAKSDEFDLGI